MLRTLRTNPRKNPGKNDAPEEVHGKWRRMSQKLQEKRQIYIPLAFGSLVCLSTILNETRGKIFVVDSGASMHMLSKKDLNSAELGTVRVSRNPTTVMTANGEVQTKYVYDLDLFVAI